MSTKAFTFHHINSDEFTVNNHYIRKDMHGNWIANPPITSTPMQLAVNSYIKALEKK